MPSLLFDTFANHHQHVVQRNLNLFEFSSLPGFFCGQQAQVAAGSLCGEREVVTASDFALIRCCASLPYYLTGQFISDRRLVVGFAGPQEGLLLNGRRVEPGQLFVMAPWQCNDAFVPKGYWLQAMVLKGPKASQALSVMCQYIDDAKAAVICSPSNGAFGCDLNALLAEGMTTVQARLLCALQEVHVARARANDRGGIFSKAAKLMLEQPFRFRKIAEVAAMIPISQRGLEKAFALAGCSPGEFLRAMQLNCFRNALLASGSSALGSLSDIAQGVGATNYSRLSKDYKSFFCELPTNTRRLSLKE